jgi:hypothetical protein
MQGGWCRIAFLLARSLPNSALLFLILNNLSAPRRSLLGHETHAVIDLINKWRFPIIQGGGYFVAFDPGLIDFISQKRQVAEGSIWA